MLESEVCIIAIVLAYPVVGFITGLVQFWHSGETAKASDMIVIFVWPEMWIFGMFNALAWCFVRSTRLAQKIPRRRDQ